MVISDAYYVQGYFGMNFDDFPGVRNSDAYVSTFSGLVRFTWTN